MADITRRELLYKVSMFGSLMATGGAVFAAESKTENKNAKPTVLENIGRQHGLVFCILLVYATAAKQLQEKKETDFAALSDTRDLVREYMEQFHNDLSEEKYAMVWLDKANVLTAEVAELRKQHTVSRQLTDRLGVAIKNKQAQEAATTIGQFINMYLGHAAWENGIVFPPVKKFVSEAQYIELGERLLEEEDKLFGKGGLEVVYDRVANLMRRFGIFDLSAFTAKL